jgi:hypothetical protein
MFIKFSKIFLFAKNFMKFLRCKITENSLIFLQNYFLENSPSVNRQIFKGFYSIAYLELKSLRKKSNSSHLSSTNSAASLWYWA